MIGQVVTFYEMLFSRKVGSARLVLSLVSNNLRFVLSQGVEQASIRR